MAAILLAVVYASIGLALTLLLGGSTSTVTAAVLTALAIVALVRARPVLRTTRFVTLVALVGGTRSLLAGAVGRMTLLLLRTVVMIPRCHGFLRTRPTSGRTRGSS